MKRWFMNMRIQKKLLIGFSSCILISLILGVACVLSMISINGRYTFLINGAVTGSQKAEEAGKEYVIARRNLLLAAYIGDNSQEVKDALSGFDTAISNVNELLQWQVNALENDPLFAEDPRAASAADGIKMLQKAVTVDYVNVKNEIADEINRGSAEGGIDKDLLRNIILMKATPIANEINEAINSCIIETKMAVDEVSKLTTLEMNRGIIIIAVTVGAAILCSMICSIVIGRAIRKPIEDLRKSAGKIAEGDFTVQIRSNGKDEISDLSNMFGNIIDMFIMTAEEINKSYLKLSKGKMEVNIDEEIFPGDYKKTVAVVNNLINDFHGIMGALIWCVADYSKGNFDSDIIRFPGEQAFVHEVFDTLQNNLKLVDHEINELIKNAIAGNLGQRLDESHYAGDWLKIVKGLNRLMEAVEKPISEVAAVLSKVSDADFGVSVKGEYKGQFNVMKKAVNKTVVNTAAYINDISDILAKMSDQNLDIVIDKEYIGDFKTIKEALLQIITTFNKLIGEFNASASQVAAGANQINVSSLSLSQGAAEQASSIEELNATIEALGRQTSVNVEKLEEASSLSSIIKLNGVESVEKMDEMLKSMSEIDNASHDIYRIIKVIEDIAFQTNLLALNAAVEAARAGEHGKGFAVVAEEVRTLANRSQKAASETTELISKTVGLVSGGTKTANNTSDSLNKMVEEIAGITTLIEGVAAASKEQDTAIYQITEGIGQISGVTQTNTASAEETASAAHELLNRSEILRDSIAHFKFKKL